MTSSSTPFLRVALVVAATLLSLNATAQRVSLSGIDAKLDRLLAGPFNLTNHVTLVSNFSTESACTQDRAYFRQNPAGDVDSNEFVVPAGHTLFITDISWQAFDNPTDFVVGRTLVMSLLSRSPSGLLRTVYYSPKIDITTANQNARPGNNESVTAGVLFNEGHTVCASIGNFSQSAFAANTITSSVLRGFLVENE